MNLLETTVSFEETKKRSLIDNQSVNRNDENFEESLRK
jgi:hypothetical protein